jgi:hypothetical protein
MIRLERLRLHGNAQTDNALDGNDEVINCGDSIPSSAGRTSPAARIWQQPRAARGATITLAWALPMLTFSPPYS